MTTVVFMMLVLHKYGRYRAGEQTLGENLIREFNMRGDLAKAYQQMLDDERSTKSFVEQLRTANADLTALLQQQQQQPPTPDTPSPPLTADTLTTPKGREVGGPEDLAAIDAILDRLEGQAAAPRDTVSLSQLNSSH